MSNYVDSLQNMKNYHQYYSTNNHQNESKLSITGNKKVKMNEINEIEDEIDELPPATDIDRDLANLFEHLNVISFQNNRFLITGASGGGKTHLAFQLIFFVLPRYKRHLYIYGGFDELKDKALPEFKRLGVKIFDKPIENSNELKDIDFEALGRGDLVFVDDLSHLMANRDNELLTFLNKCYTCSRQKGFDVITIAHKLKMNNTMIRENCTKLFFTSLSTSLKEEFGHYIVRPDVLPIVLDVTNNFKQQYIDLSQASKRMTHYSHITERLVIDPNRIPRFVRVSKKPFFVDVTSGTEKYQYQLPRAYSNFIEHLAANKQGKFIQEIKDPIISQRNAVLQGESAAGNNNTYVDPKDSEAKMKILPPLTMKGYRPRKRPYK